MHSREPRYHRDKKRIPNQLGFIKGCCAVSLEPQLPLSLRIPDMSSGSPFPVLLLYLSLVLCLVFSVFRNIQSTYMPKAGAIIGMTMAQ